MMNGSFFKDIDSITGDLRDKSMHKPGIKQTCILYSLSLILLIFLGSRAQRSGFYSGIAITEFVLVLLPPLILLFLYGYDIKRVLRLNRISLLNIFIIFWIMVFAIPVVNVLNAGYYLLIKYVFGSIILPGIPAATGLKSLVTNILIIGSSAGICEEVLFRGVIMRGFEKFGAARAILLTALLFGLWHLYFQSFLGTFLLGTLIGFIVYRTDSLFGGMFAHFTNNSLAVLAGYFSNRFADSIKSPGFSGTSGNFEADRYFSSLLNMPGIQLTAVVIAWTFTIMFCSAILAGLIAVLIKNTPERPRSIPEKVILAEKKGFLWLLPGFALIAFIFYADALLLKGMTIEAVDGILKFIGLK